MELTSVIPSVSRSLWRGAAALVLAGLATPAAAQSPAPQPTMAQLPATAAEPAAPVGPVRRVSIDEAVTMALEQNVALQVQRMSPEISELDVVSAYGGWLPTLNGQLFFQSLEQPVNTLLQGNTQSFQQDQFFGNFGVEQVLPTGGSYSVGR